MRKLIKYGMFFMVFGIAMSCQNEKVQPEEEMSQLEIDAAKIDKLLEEARPDLAEQASKMNDDKVITFEVVKNLKTNEITIENIKQVNFFPIPIASEKTPEFTEAEYQVDCDNGDSSWSKSCGGKWSCGKLIAKCLDEGGCATICQQQQQKSTERLFASVEVTFIPSSK